MTGRNIDLPVNNDAWRGHLTLVHMSGPSSPVLLLTRSPHQAMAALFYNFSKYFILTTS